jgi:hypothetical protein
MLGSTCFAPERLGVPSIIVYTDTAGYQWGFWFDSNGVLRSAEPATYEAAGFNFDTGGTVVGLSKNFSTASQGAGFASDTYVTNSGLLVPTSGLVAGMRVTWRLTATKTAAGTATPIYTIRLGAAGTVADTAILALTAVAQTAAADDGTLTVTGVLRDADASSVLVGSAAWQKALATAVGFGGAGISGVSSAFDATGRAGQYFGLSINGGASAAWTVTSVYATLER